MLKGLHYKGPLSSGVYGYTDLYKDKNGNLLVLKTQRLADYDVKRKGANISFSPETYLIGELKFFVWVDGLDESIRKYFMRFVRSEIDTTTKFDSARLSQNKYYDERSEVLKDSPYVYKSLLTYAGNTIREFVEKSMIRYFRAGRILAKRDQDFYELVINDMITIVKHTWKAGFLLDDVHFENICWDGANVVLIDYGEIKLINRTAMSLHSSTGNKTTQLYYDSKYDLWSVIRFALNIDYHNVKIAFNYSWYESLEAFGKAIILSKSYKTLKSYIKIIFSKTEIKNKVNDIFNDLESNNNNSSNNNDSHSYNDITYVFEQLNGLWLLFEPDEYNRFWMSDSAINTTKGIYGNFPLLVPTAIIIKILDNYHSIIEQ